MRTGLWPGLLAAVQYNRKRQHARLRLFEHGLRFARAADGSGFGAYYRHLLEARRLPRVVELVVEEASGKVPVLAGAGGYDTAGVVEAAKAMHAAGADALLSTRSKEPTPTTRALVAFLGSEAIAGMVILVAEKLRADLDRGHALEELQGKVLGGTAARIWGVG